MLRIMVEVDIDPVWVFAVKEELAMMIEERFDKTARIVSVEEKNADR